MENIHIASKYRPHTLSELKGHDAAKITVKNWMATDTLPQVLLFVGQRGCGKTTLARIISKWVNCENPTEDGPCGCCDACKSIDNDSCIDVKEIDCASNNKIEHVLSMLEDVSYLPQEVKKKVVILDEVHNINKQGFDKLLKPLEEPEDHVIYILCTTEKDKIPATILSRCIQLQFAELPNDVICSHIKEVVAKEGKEIDDDAVSLIAKIGEGSVRDSLSALQPLLVNEHITRDHVASFHGILSTEQISSIIMAIGNGDTSVLATYLNDIQLRHMSKTLSGILSMLQYVLFIKMGAPIKDIDCMEECNQLAGAFDFRTIKDIFLNVAKIPANQPYLIIGKLISICADDVQSQASPSEVEALKKELDALKKTVSMLSSGNNTPRVEEKPVKAAVTPITSDVKEESKKEPEAYDEPVITENVVVESKPSTAPVANDALAALFASAENVDTSNEGSFEDAVAIMNGTANTTSNAIEEEVRVPIDQGEALTLDELRMVADMSEETPISEGSGPSLMDDFFSDLL